MRLRSEVWVAKVKGSKSDRATHSCHNFLLGGNDESDVKVRIQKLRVDGRVAKGYSGSQTVSSF